MGKTKKKVLSWNDEAVQVALQEIFQMKDVLNQFIF